MWKSESEPLVKCTSSCLLAFVWAQRQWSSAQEETWSTWHWIILGAGVCWSFLRANLNRFLQPQSCGGKSWKKKVVVAEAGRKVVAARHTGRTSLSFKLTRCEFSARLEKLWVAKPCLLNWFVGKFWADEMNFQACLRQNHGVGLSRNQSWTKKRMWLSK